MTPRESREIFIDSILSQEEQRSLQQKGLYQKYTEGKISVEDIYLELKDQGI
jgi:adenylylsulfate kinase-like enzyme